MQKMIDYSQYMDEEYLELESFIEIEEKTLEFNTKKRKRKNKTIFSVEEKKKLAMLVEQHPSIWSLADRNHSNLDAVNADWRAISEALLKTVDDCKVQWKSLRDSHRYHKTAKKLEKSGSAAKEFSEDNDEHLSEDTVDWEFSACLSFLTPASSKRRTFTNASVCEKNLLEDVEAQQVATSSAPCSSYTYKTARPQKKDGIAENVASITQTVTDLIQMRKECTNGPSQPRLVHYSLLANLDRVLQKLPDDEVEELGLRFQQQAVIALREKRQRSPGT